MASALSRQREFYVCPSCPEVWAVYPFDDGVEAAAPVCAGATVFSTEHEPVEMVRTAFVEAPA